MSLGATIKEIRKSKGMNQDALAQGIMSRSNLSRFEGGSYFPGYPKFVQVLDRLEMSLEELLLLQNGLVPPLKRRFHLDMVEAGNRYDFAKVKAISRECLALYEETRTETYYHLYLLGQGVLIQHSRPDQIRERKDIAAVIKPYLLGVENWYLYEFKLLNNFLFSLDLEDAIFFGTRAVSEFTRYQHFIEGMTTQQHLMQNIALHCLENREYGKSLIFFEKALSLADKTNLLYDKIITCIYYEIALICLNKRNTSENLAGYLDVLKRLDFTDSYQALLQDCLKHIPSFRMP
ncbi:helix-turn-helix domain-containing protein [Gorillibacterium massiliense]|uniref:helix-turn-helix domain-containing protein n=1 Tax=Gorillibacterium massiliense TaxID=1280390 RepID=UPI0004B76B84|nr:Rgg/GadR/MutR family transcriptional regulator [Gorillibacterium massiliense]